MFIPVATVPSAALPKAAQRGAVRPTRIVTRRNGPATFIHSCSVFLWRASRSFARIVGRGCAVCTVVSKPICMLAVLNVFGIGRRCCDRFIVIRIVNSDCVIGVETEVDQPRGRRRDRDRRLEFRKPFWRGRRGPSDHSTSRYNDVIV